MESSNSTEECTNSTAENEPECYAVLVGLKRKPSSPEETTDEKSCEEDMKPYLTKPSSSSNNDDDDNNDCEEQQKANSVSDSDDNCEEGNSSSALGRKRKMKPLQNENDEAENGYPFQTPKTPRDKKIRRDLRLRTPWAPRRNSNLRRKYDTIHLWQPDFTQELTPFDVIPYNASL